MALPPAHVTQQRPYSLPRKFLTGDDRDRMRRYKRYNPKVKQKELGAMFGVERSTVSKILKERHLSPDGRKTKRIRMKQVKGKSPSIERAPENWAQKQAILTDSEEIYVKRGVAIKSDGDLEVHGIHGLALLSGSELTFSFNEHESSNGSTMSTDGLQPPYPPSLASLCPTLDDALKALHTLFNYFCQVGLDQSDFNVILSLIQKMGSTQSTCQPLGGPSRSAPQQFQPLTLMETYLNSGY